MAQFALGYVAEPLPGHENYRGRLAIPYIRFPRVTERNGIVVTLRFRCLEDHNHKDRDVCRGKYLGLPGELGKPRLYNTRAIQIEHDEIAITEGELDAITATLAGVPAVGIPGATSWRTHFRAPFLGYAHVWVLADGDAAGTQFGEMVTGYLDNATVVQMPEGKDVNDFVNENGQDALKEMIDDARRAAEVRAA